MKILAMLLFFIILPCCGIEDDYEEPDAYKPSPGYKPCYVHDDTYFHCEGNICLSGGCVYCEDIRDGLCHREGLVLDCRSFDECSQES